jgi:hypothetical protein
MTVAPPPRPLREAPRRGGGPARNRGRESGCTGDVAECRWSPPRPPRCTRYARACVLSSPPCGSSLRGRKGWRSARGRTVRARTVARVLPGRACMLNDSRELLGAHGNVGSGRTCSCPAEKPLQRRALTPVTRDREGPAQPSSSALCTAAALDGGTAAKRGRPSSTTRCARRRQRPHDLAPAAGPAPTMRGAPGAGRRRAPSLGLWPPPPGDTTPGRIRTCVPAVDPPR